jgi:hypothetical protein
VLESGPSSVAAPQDAECQTENLFDFRICAARVGSHVGQRTLRFAFAEPERAQRAERFLERRRRVGVHHAAIGFAVRVPKGEARRYPSIDEKLPAVLRSMVRTAQDDDVVGIVVATLRAKVDMVKIQINAVSTPGDHAPTAVASHDLTTNAWRDVLPSTLPA